MIKKRPETVRWNTYLNPASREVTGFSELLGCFERNISILGRSFRTFAHYSRYIAAITLHYQCLHSQWDTKQIKEYLFELQQRSKTPISNLFQTYCIRTSILTKDGRASLQTFSFVIHTQR